MAVHEAAPLVPAHIQGPSIVPRNPSIAPRKPFVVVPPTLVIDDSVLMVTLPATFANAYSHPDLTKFEERQPYDCPENVFFAIHDGMKQFPREDGNLTVPLAAYRTGKIPGAHSSLEF